MGIWLRFKNWIGQLFGVASLQNDDELSEIARNAERFFDTTKENITAIVSNSLATMAFGDGDIVLTSPVENSPRIDELNNLLQKEFVKAKRNVAAGLGVGMIATIPYSVDNGLGRKVYTATVTKDRIFVTGMQGDEITACTVISDVYAQSGKTFFRWTNYSVDNGVYTITNKATSGGEEIPLTSVPMWASIEPEIRIGGVDRLPIAIFRCPTANRRPDDVAGVPITFGCDATLEKIAKTMADIEREYELKKIKVFADRSLLREDYGPNGQPIPGNFSDDLFVKMGQTDNPTIDIFDPSIRDSAYYVKLQQHFAFLEKEIGVSRGILTDSDSRNATATEVRRAMYATFCTLDDIHGEYERYIEDLIYGVNVLYNFYGIGQQTEYNISYDWSYALLEDTASTFAQLMQGVGIGAVDPVEVRRFLKPDETEEEARNAVEEIQAKMRISTMLGVTGNDLPED